MKYNFEVNDYLMAPYIMPEDLVTVFGDIQYQGNGRDLVAIEVKEKIYIGSFIKYGSHFHLIQVSNNKAFLIKDVKILGRVVEVFDKNGIPKKSKKKGSRGYNM